MNRKQGIIIVILLALIVTAGVMASRFNSPLLPIIGQKEPPTSVPYSDTENNLKSESDNLQVGSFASVKTERSQTFAKTVQSLKNMMQDKDISEETKKEAESKYLDVTLSSEYESKVEIALKAKGYEDVVCIIQNQRAMVVIKSKEALDEKSAREIKNEVARITKIVDIDIEVKE